MKYKSILLALILWETCFSYSQTISKGTELQELVRISQVYSNISSLSFDLKYTYADSLTWHDITDSSFATCKLSYGQSFVSDSSFEYLRNNNYNVFVDKEDSLVYAIKQTGDLSILEVPMLDSIFRTAFVDSVYIEEVDDSTWRFVALFKPESYYSYYELNYDPETALIKSINYHGRNETGAHDIPQDHIVCATIYMSNYSFDELDAALFNENRYFYNLNGALYLQPAWQDYHFENY